MPRPNLILSPCGTSLLTNGIGQELRSAINRHSNARNAHEVAAAAAEEHRLIRDHLASVAESLNSADIAAAKKLSAELNGILSLYAGNLAGHSHDFHQLLCTDTWLGEEAAKLVLNWLQGNGLTVALRRQPDLRTVDLTSFQSALSDLVKWCEDEIGHYRKSHHVVFNLTGGFKSIQGFLQTLAQFYADETVYIFETGNELLRLPRLPLRMDAEDTVRQHLDSFRSLALGLEAAPCVERIPETMLLTIDGQTCLSPWGDLVWAQTKKKLYTETILSPQGITGNLLFGNDFAKSTEGLEENRRIMVNERIDDLIRYLAEKLTGKAKPHNPPSLDFKKLTGNPCPPSTHECDAWADQDAKRLFGHFDTGGRFILDRLGKALH